MRRDRTARSRSRYRIIVGGSDGAGEFRLGRVRGYHRTFEAALAQAMELACEGMALVDERVGERRWSQVAWVRPAQSSDRADQVVQAPNGDRVVVEMCRRGDGSEQAVCGAVPGGARNEDGGQVVPFPARAGDGAPGRDAGLEEMDRLIAQRERELAALRCARKHIEALYLLERAQDRPEGR